MDDVAVCMACHNELTRRGEPVLQRCLDSLSRAMTFAARALPGIDVYVACCDDASTDATPEYIERHFAGRDWFRLVRNKVNRCAGFSRNVAASLFNTALICMLDPDDEYMEDHLAVCHTAMNALASPTGKRFAMVSNGTEFNVPVDPSWVEPICMSIPITKVIRREAWEFVEGMPMEYIYRRTTSEDCCLLAKVSTFFHVRRLNHVTSRYWCYPGSAFANQLPKFQRPQSQQNPELDLPAADRPFFVLAARTEATFVQYLWAKLQLPGWKEKLSQFAVNYA